MAYVWTFIVLLFMAAIAIIGILSIKPLRNAVGLGGVTPTGIPGSLSGASA